MVSIGGGGVLSFQVKAYASESSIPATEAENTIAVVTGTAISSYVFSSAQPKSPSAGMVWIKVGASGDGFNALKGTKNALNVYPLIIHQYVNGTWVAKTSKIYQAGKWKSFFDGVFLNGGTLTKVYPHSEKKDPASCTVTYGSDGVTCYTTGRSASEIYVVFGPIDLSGVNTLSASATSLYTKGGYVNHVLFVATGNNESYKNAKAIAAWTREDMNAQAAFSQSLNVSHLTGNYYIYVGTNTMGGAWANQRSVRYTKLTME